MDWTDLFLSPEMRNRRDIKSANQKMQHMRRRMIEKTGRDHQQDARLLALEQENDQLKLMLMDLINLLQSKGVIAEQDTVDIIKCAAVVIQEEASNDDEDNPLIDFQRALREEE
ncbi:MAG: hypothetical protein KTR15_04200 [Phycisphaeraceae bacterium]|nr:hypothetical protein [Phycisphaeraceae bacterium]